MSDRGGAARAGSQGEAKAEPTNEPTSDRQRGGREGQRTEDRPSEVDVRADADARDADEDADGDTDVPDVGSWALVFGLASVAWAIAILVPHELALPSWPAASVGVLAIVVARFPGRALPRALGSFLGLFGCGVGMAKIAILWGVLELLGG